MKQGKPKITKIQSQLIKVCDQHDGPNSRVVYLVNILPFGRQYGKSGILGGT